MKDIYVFIMIRRKETNIFTKSEEEEAEKEKDFSFVLQYKSNKTIKIKLVNKGNYNFKRKV